MKTLSVLALTLAALSVAAGQTACDGDCAGTFDKCVGRDIFSLKSCCEEGDECVMKNRFFGQCRPTSSPRFVPNGWAGPVVDCRECGTDSLQPGEFNFDTSDDCDIDFLGSFTLEDCGSVCAGGGYVACDRVDISPDESGSCYGYFELFEGACSMRNDNFVWNSWLTCKGNGGGHYGYGDADAESLPGEPVAFAASATVAAEEDDSGMTAEEHKAADEEVMSKRKLA